MKAMMTTTLLTLALGTAYASTAADEKKSVSPAVASKPADTTKKDAAAPAAEGCKPEDVKAQKKEDRKKKAKEKTKEICQQELEAAKADIVAALADLDKVTHRNVCKSVHAKTMKLVNQVKAGQHEAKKEGASGANVEAKKNEAKKDEAKKDEAKKAA